MMSGTIKDVTRRFTVGRKGIGVLFAVAVAALSTGSARGAYIDVDLRTATAEVIIGETVEVEVWLVSRGSAQEWVAADLWLEWNPGDDLNYLGREDNPNLTFGSISVQTPAVPPSTVYWGATSDNANPLMAGSDPGTLVTTLQFETKSVSENVLISVFQRGGPWTSITDGYDELLGTMGSTKISIAVPEPTTACLLILGGLLSMRRRRR